MAYHSTSEGGTTSDSSGPRLQDIYSRALECKSLFHRYSSLPTPYSEDISKYQQRFLTWASFLGVFAAESASLDRRLEFNPEIKEPVVAMLQVLRRNLERALVRHTPNTSGSKVERKDDDGALYGITGAVDRLYRLTVAIRHSPRTDEVERVRKFASKQRPDGFTNLVSAIVWFHFPGVEKTLHAQLVESITYRRHRMLWSRRHSKKLAQERAGEEETQPTTGKASTPVDASSGNTIPASLSQGHFHPGSQVKSVYSSTVPSKRRINMNRVVRIREESKREEASSARSSNPPPKFQYPGLPQPPPGKMQASCPYCLDNIDVSDHPEKANKEWITHLDDDLRPYVCVSEACKDFPVAFGSTKDWESHMDNTHGTEWARNIHRVRWHCLICDDSTSILSEDLLVRHLKDPSVKGHGEIMDQFEFERIKSKCKRTSPREPRSCPLCAWPDEDKAGYLMDEPQTISFQKHFVRHLQQLALLSISWWTEDTGEGVDGLQGDGDASASAVGRNSQIDANEERQTNTVLYIDDKTLDEFEKKREADELQGQASPLALQQRREYIAGAPIEPPDAPPGGVTLSDIKTTNPETQVSKDSVIDDMMETRFYIQGILPSLESIQVPGYDNTSVCEAIQSSALSRGKADDGNVAFVVSDDNLDNIVTHTFVQEFFHRLVESFDSIEDRYQESLIRYCTNSVHNPLIYYSPETEREILASRRKLFAILSLTKIPEKIVFFIRHGISDLDLPLRVVSLEAPSCQSGSGKDLPLPSDLSGELLDKFLVSQQLICDLEDLEVHSLPTNQQSIMVPTPAKKRFSLLIGVGAYFNDESLELRKFENGEPVSLRNLPGAVNDVEIVRVLLETQFGFEKPTILLSSPSKVSSRTHQEPDTLPTHETIQKRLSEICEETIEGDTFLFYFTGHGALLQSLTTSPLDGRQRDPSLLTADYLIGKPAVRGWELNHWLRQFGDKGVRVVVIIDSSYSGGAWCNNDQRRTPSNWSTPHNLASDEIGIPNTQGRPGNLDGETETILDLDLQDITVMTACKGTEITSEMMEDGSIYGAFTLALKKCLQTHGPASTYRMIRDGTATILSSWNIQQSPQVFGQDRVAFLQDSEPTTTTPVLGYLKDSRVSLDVGKIHGINPGTEFISTSVVGVKVVITETTDYTSTAEVCEGSITGLSQPIQLVPYRWSMAESLKVTVDQTLGPAFKTHLDSELQKRLVGKSSYLDRPTMHDENDEQVIHLHLEKAKNDKINIFGQKWLTGNEGPILGWKLEGQTTQERAEESAIAIRHLFRFGQIRRLQSNTNVEAPFVVSISPAAGKNAASRFEYKFRNIGDKNLYLVVFCLSAGFHVRQLYPGVDNSKKVQRGGEESFEFRFIPPDVSENKEAAQGQRAYCDTIRTIVMKGKSLSMKSIELPNIQHAGEWEKRPVWMARDGEDIPTFNWWIHDTLKTYIV